MSRPVAFARWTGDLVVVEPADRKDTLKRAMFTEADATKALGARTVARLKADPNVWLSLYPVEKKEASITKGLPDEDHR